MLVYLIMVISSAAILGPGSWNGWLNRLVVLSYCGWLMTVSWRAIQLRKNAVDASVRTATSRLLAVGPQKKHWFNGGY